MATGNNIKSFSAADIERYHKGMLSAKERHDLEKAALDDPFLADALEGYTVAGQDAQKHLADLRTRLTQKVDGATVIPINEEKKKRAVPWLRVAALVIVLAGAALLANQFVFNNKKKGDIAEAPKTKEEDIKSPDTTTTSNVVTTTPGTKDGPAPVIKEDGKGTKLEQEVATGEVTRKNPESDLSKTSTDGLERTVPVVTTNNNPSGGVITNPPAGTAGADTKLKVPDAVKEKTKDIATADKKQANKDADGVMDRFDDFIQQKRNETASTTRRAANEDFGKGFTNNTNTFRGRVTDANNIGVPFANVTNTQDNNAGAGTYTDAKGYFNLTYPDSVLSVQVRSIGFENTNVQLRNAVPNNQVVLQDDRKTLSEVVISNQKPNAELRNRNQAMNVTLEEPEPADGWDNYDAYLANNLNAPEEIKTKQNTGGQVQVSFEVNKEGEPVNIKIEKSLCSKCDKEAIRLIKEGPKWKRNANKKGRTTVTINF